MNRWLYKVLTCALVSLCIVGCSASSKTAQNAAEVSQTADSQTKSQTIRFSDLPPGSYQYSYDRFKVIIPRNKEDKELANRDGTMFRMVRSLQYAEDLYQSLFADAPSNNTVIYYDYEYFDVDDDGKILMIVLNTVSDGISARYAISAGKQGIQNFESFVSKIYKMDGEQKTYVKDTIEYKDRDDDDSSRFVHRIVNSHDYDKIRFSYPEDIRRDDKHELFGDEAYLRLIDAYIEYNLIPEVLGSEEYERVVDSDKPFIVQCEGVSQTNNKKALIFTISTEKDGLLFMTGIDSDAQIYIYEAQPIFVTNIPSQIEAPMCESKHKSVYYYPGFSISVKSEHFKRGRLTLQMAAAGAVEAIRSMNYVLPAVTIQDLDVGFTGYSLVAGGAVKHRDSDRWGSNNEDKIALRIDDVVKIEGSDAYVLTVGVEKKWNTDFVANQKIAVSQTGKLYTFTYVPVLFGKLGKVAAPSNNYMFKEEYYTTSDCSGFFSEDTDYKMKFEVSIDIESEYMDDPELIVNDCSNFEKMAEYIQSHYIAESAHKLQEWFILLADRTELDVIDENGEEIITGGYEFHVGERSKSGKLKVIAKITFGDDGIVRVEDESDGFRELGKYKNSAE